jgi:hypothetical protein
VIDDLILNLIKDNGTSTQAVEMADEAVPVEIPALTTTSYECIRELCDICGSILILRLQLYKALKV